MLTQKDNRPTVLSQREPLSHVSAPQDNQHLSHEDAIDQARLFKALADPTRLRIIEVLSRHGGNLTVQELTDCFTLAQPTISHHLHLLLYAGLVEARKNGLYSYYYLRPAAFTQAQVILSNFVTACETYHTQPGYHEQQIINDSHVDACPCYSSLIDKHLSN